MNYIQIKNLSKRYFDVNALENINIKISKGSLFGLLGPNGAGKTTLLKILATLISPDDGKVQINEIDNRSPTQNDLSTHLSTIFTENRLKKYIELRSMDTCGWDCLCAGPAFNVGLFHRIYLLSDPADIDLDQFSFDLCRLIYLSFLFLSLCFV